MIERITYQFRKYIFLVVIFLPLVAHSTNEIPIDKKGLKQSSGFIENKGQIINQNNMPNPAVLYLLNTQGENASPPAPLPGERGARCESLSGPESRGMVSERNAIK